MNLMCNNFYLNLIYGLICFCVLIVFSFLRESLKQILVNEPLILRWLCHMMAHRWQRDVPATGASGVA
jgi:hypothetical protein